MKYKWPAAGSYPETYRYLGKSQSFLKNPDRVTLRKGNICHLPFEDEKFDAVICLSVLEHVSLDGLDELHRVAKRGAMIIIGIPINTIFTTVG